MPTEFSFDVVSELDRQELRNALDQARREVLQRHDFKGAHVEILDEEKFLTLHADTEFRLEQIKDIIQTRAVRRGLSLKAFRYNKPEPAAGGTVRQRVDLTIGIPEDLAKKIVKLVRDSPVKVRTHIQGDAVRVFSQKKDDLQAVIQLLRSQDYPVDLQFTNRR